MTWEIVRGGLALLFGGLLLSAGIEDVRTREIADWKSITLCLAAPLWLWLNGVSLWPGALAQVAVAAGLFGLCASAFHYGLMGGGDVKLIGAVALWLPLSLLATMLVIMSLVGGAITLLLAVERLCRRGTKPIEVPYGVAIAMAGLLVLNEPILNQFG